MIAGFHIKIEADLPVFDQISVECRGRQTVGLDSTGWMNGLGCIHADIADCFDPVSQSDPDRIAVDHPFDSPDNRCLQQEQRDKRQKPGNARENAAFRVGNTGENITLQGGECP